MLIPGDENTYLCNYKHSHINDLLAIIKNKTYNYTQVTQLLNTINIHAQIKLSLHVMTYSTRKTMDSHIANGFTCIFKFSMSNFEEKLF